MFARTTNLIFFVLVLPALSDTRAQGPDGRVLPVNGRQVQEIRLGATARAPGSGMPGAGLVAVVLTNGPVAGTTTLMGALLDGATLFDGGAQPAFAPIVAQGSVFSVGGGCRRGAFTDFPYIGTNRPQIARYDAGTGSFTTLTPVIGNNDLYDSAECAVDSNDTVYAFTNRTRTRIEVYKDNGGGLMPVQVDSITNIRTPFNGGLRPSLVAVEPQGAAASSRTHATHAGATLGPATGVGTGEEGVDVAIMNNQGSTELLRVGTDSGVFDNRCLIAVSIPPTSSSKPRETGMFAPDDDFGVDRVVVGDFDFNGSTDFRLVTSRELCTFTLGSATAGSADGGNGYDWTGYAVSQSEPLEQVGFFWSLYYSVAAGTTTAIPGGTSPYAGRGGPFDACSGDNLDRGPTSVVVGTGAQNTELQFWDANTAIGGAARIFESGMENDAFVPNFGCGLSF